MMRFVPSQVLLPWLTWAAIGCSPIPTAYHPLAAPRTAATTSTLSLVRVRTPAQPHALRKPPLDARQVPTLRRSNCAANPSGVERHGGVQRGGGWLGLRPLLHPKTEGSFDATPLRSLAVGAGAKASVLLESVSKHPRQP